jgi:hypothetical protein
MPPYHAKFAELKFSFIICHLGNWPFNFNYWTRGKRIGFPGQWSWCNSGNTSTKLDPDLSIDIKSARDSCTHLKIKSNGTGLKLTNKKCSGKFVAACQVKQQIYYS